MPEARTEPDRGLEDIVQELAGPVIGSILRMLEITEEEIGRAKRKYPSKAHKIDLAFILCKPTEVLKGKCDQVYRAHVRELIVRAMRGADARPGTAAEVLCGMLGAATVSPLNAEGAALVERLFQIVMRQELEGAKFRPVWEGQVEEAFAWAQRKMAQPWRR